MGTGGKKLKNNQEDLKGMIKFQYEGLDYVLYIIHK